MRRFILIALLGVAATSSLLARGASSGFCEQGAVKAIVSGQQSVATYQGSYPFCTVTVYSTGTTNLATLYADNSGTPLGNPFVADSKGHWLYFVDNSTNDVQFSGGGITGSFTRGSITALDPLQPSDGVLDCAGGNPLFCFPSLQAAVTAAGGRKLYITGMWSLGTAVTVNTAGLSIVCLQSSQIKAVLGSITLLHVTATNVSVNGCQFNANAQSYIVGILDGGSNFIATYNSFTGNNTLSTGMNDICIVSCYGGGTPVTGVYLGHNRHINTYQGDTVWDADAVEIDGEYATGLTGDGIYNNTDLGTFTNGASFVAHDWVFQNMHRYCEEIAGNGMATWKITHNHCETTGGDAGGISGGSDSSGGMTDQLVGGVISDNTMLGVGTPTGGSLGIEVYGRNYTISDNKVSGAFETGILYGVCNSVFRGNVFTGIGINGVEGQGMQQNFTFVMSSCTPTGGGNNVFTENVCTNVLHICISAGLPGDIVSNNTDSRAPGYWSTDASPGVGYLSFLNNGGGLSTGQPTLFSNNVVTLLPPVNGFSLSSPGAFNWNAFYSNAANPIILNGNTIANRNSVKFGTSFATNANQNLNAMETNNVSIDVATVNEGAGNLTAFVGGFGQNYSLIGTGSGIPAIDYTINLQSMPVTYTVGSALDGGIVTAQGSVTNTPYSGILVVTPAGTPLTSAPLFTVNMPTGGFINAPNCTIQPANESAMGVPTGVLYAPVASSAGAAIFYAGTTALVAATVYWYSYSCGSRF